MPPEIIALLQASANPLLGQVFGDQEADSTAPRGLSKVVTVVAKFKVRYSLHLLCKGLAGNKLNFPFLKRKLAVWRSFNPQ